jgi:hypothetical protein
MGNMSKGSLAKEEVRRRAEKVKAAGKKYGGSAGYTKESLRLSKEGDKDLALLNRYGSDAPRSRDFMSDSPAKKPAKKITAMKKGGPVKKGK